eukprot:3179116-Rhodomonas_salina.5
MSGTVLRCPVLNAELCCYQADHLHAMDPCNLALLPLLTSGTRYPPGPFLRRVHYVCMLCAYAPPRQCPVLTSS